MKPLSYLPPRPAISYGCMLDAALFLMEAEWTSYTKTLGLPEIERDSWDATMRRLNGAERLAVLCGASEAAVWLHEAYLQAQARRDFVS